MQPRCPQVTTEPGFSFRVPQVAKHHQISHEKDANSSHKARSWLAPGADAPNRKESPARGDRAETDQPQNLAFHEPDVARNQLQSVELRQKVPLGPNPFRGGR